MWYVFFISSCCSTCIANTDSSYPEDVLFLGWSAGSFLIVVLLLVLVAWFYLSSALLQCQQTKLPAANGTTITTEELPNWCSGQLCASRICPGNMHFDAPKCSCLKVGHLGRWHIETLYSHCYSDNRLYLHNPKACKYNINKMWKADT